MADMACDYAGDRDEALIAYLYDDGDPGARDGFATHLAACARCREEMDALQGVRRQLARWTPPEANFVVTSHQPPATSHRVWWHEIPAWAQVAAALLVLGVSAGLANLDVRYDGNGLSLRTGWAPPPRGAQAPPAVASGTSVTGAATPWRAELTALEQQLRGEMRAVPASAAPPVSAAARSDADLERRVRALLAESEKRQQRELALRVGEVLRDFDSARQADLRKIDNSLKGVRTDLGVQVYRQQQSLDAQQQILMRVSQRQ